jgi:hypothetical protein
VRQPGNPWIGGEEEEEPEYYGRTDLGFSVESPIFLLFGEFYSQ